MRPRNRRERGSALILVIVVLGVLTVAMAGVVRSTNTSARTAGNIAFKQAATQVGEVALAAAEAYVDTFAVSTSTDATAAANVAVANRYFATMQPTDASDIPTTVTWANVPTTAVNGYQVQWVVERMCDAAVPVDPTTNCMNLQSMQQGSQRAGSPSYSAAPSIYFRLTARVTGPRDTESFVQSAVSR